MRTRFNRFKDTYKYKFRKGAQMKTPINFSKAVIIGCGFVGSASAFSLMESGLFRELVLIDADKKERKGKLWILAMAFHFLNQ